MRKFTGTRNGFYTGFWNKIELIPFHECWEWTGLKRADGYGAYHIRNKLKREQWLAHRLSLHLHGISLDNNLVADHLCGNRGCVNPRHLRQVSIATNTTENSNSIPAKNKQKTHCPMGHAYTGQKILRSKKAWGYGRPSRVCQTCDTLAHKLKREKQREARGPIPIKTTCRQGHLMDGKKFIKKLNRYRRTCKTCERNYAVTARMARIKTK